MALPPGSYRAGVRSEGRYREARVRVPVAGGWELAESDLKDAPMAVVAAKGGREDTVRVGLAALASSAVIGSTTPLLGGELTLQFLPPGGWGVVEYLAVTAGARYGTAQGEIAFKDLEIDLSASVGRRWSVSSLHLGAAVQLGATLVDEFDLPRGETRVSCAPRAALAGTLGFPVSQRTSLVVGVEGGVALARMQDGFRAAPVVLAKVGGTYGW
ncbi:MAG: hypothetical protein QM765_26435 [Myxococcales bacterium]